ncbi:phage late control D family protein, partial [Bilophila wadsworthia]
RVEQRQESDLEFMQRITKEQGLRLAVKSDRVVVYAGQTADQLEPIAIRRASEADPGEGLDFQSFRAKRTTEGIYTQCVVGYTKAADSETIETQYEPNIPPTTGRVLYINKRIENQAQAERMAKAELRDKNRKEQTASLSGMGDTRFRAGTVLDIQGWGRFDSKYVIAQATHTFSADGGYTTSLELEKALDY